MKTESKSLVVKEETIASLDKAAADYQLSVADATPFKKTFMLAQAMNNMRALLTNEVMEPIMALMNTDLGFRTDKDPRVWNAKKNGYNEPYPVEVVRDVMIESTLRGFYPVNNELNIIAGRFYAAKNGVRRKVQNWPGLTDLKDTRAVPVMKNGGAVVQCVASWNLKGKADSLDIEIAVKVNDMMGIDAILGKAERKQMKLILDRISGEVTPDGDIDDAPIGGNDPAAAPAAGKRAPVPKEKAVAGTDATVEGGAGGGNLATDPQPENLGTPADKEPVGNPPDGKTPDATDPAKQTTVSLTDEEQEIKLKEEQMLLIRQDQEAHGWADKEMTDILKQGYGFPKHSETVKEIDDCTLGFLQMVVKALPGLNKAIEKARSKK